jgi:molybdopterin-guanine dinucleotide biosynthesis protein A
MDSTLGVIAAGGAGTRMGVDKATVELGGRTLLQHVAGALESAGLPVIVSGRPGLFHNHEAVPDIADFGGGGPALGLLSVFRKFDRADLFLVAVDQPLLRPETVTRLLRIPGDAVLPVVGEHPQVTCGLYRHVCREPLEAMLADGIFKLRRLLPRVTTSLVPESEWRQWGEDGRSWLSLDTPQALREAEALL